MVELLAGERQARESKRAIWACNDYLRLGPGRSLQKLQQLYIEPSSTKPPSKHLRTLAEWSRQYGWQARAASYDAEIERRRKEQDAALEAEREARRRQIMESGLALDFERVERLKRLEGLLIQELGEIDEQGNLVALKEDSVWAPDVKQIGSGKFAQQVDIVRFNRAIFETIRGLLDDLAKETGGRKQVGVIETPDLAPLPDALREMAKKVYGATAQPEKQD